MDINEIIYELKQNNHSHFKEFYDLTSRQVYFSAVTILKDHSLAEDIMQDTYISFLNNIDQFKEGNNVYAYLSIISRNMSINLYNKRKRVISNDEIIEQQSKEDTYFANSEINKILEILDNQEEREIIVYHIIFDYKFKDISRILKKPLGTVLWLYNKALKKLKERMVKQDEN